jgi:hypothetical protein
MQRIATLAALLVPLAACTVESAEPRSEGAPNSAQAQDPAPAPADPRSGAGDEWQQALEHAKVALAKSRESAAREVERVLEELGPKLQQVKERLALAGEQGRAQWERLLREFEDEQGALRTKLAQLRAHGSSAWERLLMETRDAAQALAQRCDKALAERRAAQAAPNAGAESP